VIALTLFLLVPLGRLLCGTLVLPSPRVFLEELGESRELEQAVETTFPWERRSRRPPRWPFSYMWEIQLQSPLLNRKTSVSHRFTKDSKKRSVHRLRGNVMLLI